MFASSETGEDEELIRHLGPIHPLLPNLQNVIFLVIEAETDTT